MRLVWEVEGGKEEVFPFCVTTELVEKVLSTNDEYEQLNYFRGFLREQENKDWVKMTLEDIWDKLEDRKYKLVNLLFDKGAYSLEEHEGNYMLCAVDTEQVCKLYVSLDGKYVYGIEGGHTLCQGLWSEYF